MGFSGKASCALGCGSGLGTGGFVAHKNSTPYTGIELLEREGHVFFERQEDYQGIFFDQKTTLISKNIVTNTDTVQKDSSKVKKGCEKELSDSYESSDDFADKKKQIIDFCTPSGISTIKGRLAQVNEVNWIEDSTENKVDLYKAVFAVYRYDETFLGWLNADKESNKIKSTDKSSAKYTELENKCKANLKMKISEINNELEYSFTSWGCQPLPYKKVKEKLEKEPNGGKQRTDGASAAAIWNEVSEVKNKVKGDSSDDPDSSKYQTGCQTALEKELKDDDVYKDEYRVAYSICRP